MGPDGYGVRSITFIHEVCHKKQYGRSVSALQSLGRYDDPKLNIATSPGWYICMQLKES